MPNHWGARMRHRRLVLGCALGVLLALIVSVIQPYDLTTWFMEVAPILIVAPILVASYKRFPLSTLSYVLLCVFALIMIGGGHYTYARVPLGFWIKDVLGTQRNPYDKLGHFMRGVVPALLVREILLRQRWVSGKLVAAVCAVAFALAISASYELVEWWSALALGSGADDFLGTQGDPWDTQSDMFMALIGASVAMILLTRWQDRQIAELTALRNTA